MTARLSRTLFSTFDTCVAGPSRLPLAHARQGLPQARSFTATACCQSGHNRWSKIRHKKGAADAARAKVFSKLTQEIISAMRPPNSMNPETNPKLEAAIAKAREGGVTKAAIEGTVARMKSIADGTGQSMVFEALGPIGKEALMIQCITDNGQRTNQSLRKILEKYGYRLAPVSFLFTKTGIISITPPSLATREKNFDDLFEVAVDGGAEDVKEIEGDDGVEWEVYTQPNDLGSLTSLLCQPEHAKHFPVRSSEMGYIPNDPLEVTEDGTGIKEEKAEAMERCSDHIEEDQDVIKVWTNLA